VASLRIFLVKNATAPNGMWAPEFNSLSIDSLVGTRRGRPSWSPGRPGLEYHRLDDVPEPTVTAAIREEHKGVRRSTKGSGAVDRLFSWSAPGLEQRLQTPPRHIAVRPDRRSPHRSQDLVARP
jgi:hypothetical protein